MIDTVQETHLLEAISYMCLSDNCVVRSSHTVINDIMAFDSSIFSEEISAVIIIIVVVVILNDRDLLSPSLSRTRFLDRL